MMTALHFEAQAIQLTQLARKSPRTRTWQASVQPASATVVEGETVRVHAGERHTRKMQLFVLHSIIRRLVVVTQLCKF